MAANKQQGSALAGLLVGFTALPAGLVHRADHPAIGTLVGLAGGALMIGSLVETYRIKHRESIEENGGGK